MTELAPDPLQIPLFDLRLEQEDIEAVAETLRSGWLDAWARGPRSSSAAFAEHLAVATPSRCRAARPRSISRTSPRAWVPATR